MSSERDRVEKRNSAIAVGRQGFATAIDDVLDHMDRSLGVTGRRRWVLPIAAGAAGVALALLLRRRLGAPRAERLTSSR